MTCGPPPSRGRIQRTLLVLFCCLASAAFAGASAARPGTVHALLINGGERPTSNYQSHLHHLEDMVALLRGRGVAPERIHVFSADGEDPAADLTTRDIPPRGFWLIEGTSVGNLLRPQSRLIDTRWAGVTLRPARLAALREWFEAAGREILPGDELLVFVTDHGTAETEDPDENAIVLWEEELRLKEFKALLARLKPGVRVVMVMSQCYSGAFAGAMGDGSAEPSGDVCGFFSTSAKQKAYGCYAEGRDHDKMGHAFRFIDALAHTATTADAHLEVLADDDTPDLPLRTSDAYLAGLVSAEAAARRVDVDDLADSLLARAWRTPAAWEPEIRLLGRMGTAFGTFGPRRVAEVVSREKELQALTQQISTYDDSWKSVQAEAQESMVEGFLAAQPGWRSRLEPRTLEGLAPEDRAALLQELLSGLEQHARNRPGLWPRLERIRTLSARGAEARWRLEVRSAALQRMRTILVGIAGRMLISPEGEGESAGRTALHSAERQALARLRQCEDFTAGRPPDPDAETRSRSVPPFPPLSADLAVVDEIAPSWLGVRFRPLTPAVRAEHRLPAGANLLDAIYPGSPARAAGLEVGDIVLGPPARPFEEPRELREWAMTGSRGAPLALVVVRPGEQAGDDRRFEAALALRPAPAELPPLPGPPQVGDRAPRLPRGLKLMGASGGTDPKGASQLLFFWATWCEPCKKAVPEVMAFAESRGVSVLAISDEDESTISTFLAERTEPFIARVACDALRKSFISYGVSGTPTLLLVDREGVIRYRQVGYTAKGLTIDGWRWSDPRP